MRVLLWATVATLAALGGWVTAAADTAKSQCELKAAVPGKSLQKRACTFSQRQGYVTIRFDDGPVFELSPANGVGTYKDAQGRAAYRKSGLGSAGLKFQTAQGMIYVYW